MPGQKLPGMTPDELQIILSGIYCPFGMVYGRGKECFGTPVTLSTVPPAEYKWESPISLVPKHPASSRYEISGVIFLFFSFFLSLFLSLFLSFSLFLPFLSSSET